MKHTTISIDAARYIDSDHCLADAAADYVSDHPEARGYDLAPRWADEQRDRILLDVPAETASTAAAAAILGRKGGSARTPAKVAASRANGRKGGRPAQRRTVRIEVVEVGQAFGCCAILRDARTGRRLAETDDVRPYGFRSNAYRDGERMAASNGWTVASDDE